MSIVENRFVTFKRIDRFKEDEHIEKVEFENLEMDFAMKSIKLEKQEFTNLCKSLSSQQYIMLKELYHRYKNGENILSDFCLDELLPFNNMPRLKEIIRYNLVNQDFKIYEIFKFSYKKNNKIRFFIKNNNGKLSVVLIDLFHLALPSKYYDSEAEEMQKRVYSKNKENKININSIKQYYKKMS